MSWVSQMLTPSQAKRKRTNDIHFSHNWKIQKENDRKGRSRAMEEQKVDDLRENRTEWNWNCGDEKPLQFTRSSIYIGETHRFNNNCLSYISKYTILNQHTKHSKIPWFSASKSISGDNTHASFQINGIFCVFFLINSSITANEID